MTPLPLVYVLVCGGRDYKNYERMEIALDKLASKHIGKRMAIIHGGASGADTLASAYSIERNTPRFIMPAEWERIGTAAGPIRNKQMLDTFNVDAVVAFPGGNGTADMVKQARARGIKVYEVTP